MNGPCAPVRRVEDPEIAAAGGKARQHRLPGFFVALMAGFAGKAAADIHPGGADDRRQIFGGLQDSPEKWAL